MKRREVSKDEIPPTIGQGIPGGEFGPICAVNAAIVRLDGAFAIYKVTIPAQGEDPLNI